MMVNAADPPLSPIAVPKVTLFPLRSSVVVALPGSVMELGGAMLAPALIVAAAVTFSGPEPKEFDAPNCNVPAERLVVPEYAGLAPLTTNVPGPSLRQFADPESAPPKVSVSPALFTVTLVFDTRLSGALMACEPAQTKIEASPLAPLWSVSALVPAIVYAAAAFEKLKEPTVLRHFTVTTTGLVIETVAPVPKMAVVPTPLGTVLGDQLPAVPQLPLPLIFQLDGDVPPMINCNRLPVTAN